MRKTRNVLIFSLFILTVVAAAPAVAVETDAIDRSFSFRSGDRLEIDTERGSIEVRTGGDGEVRVHISVSQGAVSDYVEVRFDDRDGLRIEAEEVRGAGGSGNVQFVIDAPRDMDLHLRTDGGHVEIDDVDGEVAVKTGGGHIEFGEVGGSLSIDTGGGHIQGGRLGGVGHIETGGGHIEIGDAMGDLEVRSGGGHIEIGDVDGALTVRTGGGHVEAGHVVGDVEMKSGGGHVGLGGCEGDVTVNTGGGEIELEELEGHVLAHTGGGDIRVALAPGNGAGVDLESGDDGDIILEIPSGLGFDIDAVASGRVETDPSLGFAGNQKTDRLSGTIGGGGNVLRIRAEDGDIRIVSGR